MRTIVDVNLRLTLDTPLEAYRACTSSSCSVITVFKRLWVSFVLMISLVGCAELSKFKVDRDGMYRFKVHPIVVWAPNECLLDLAVDDAPNFVDFVTGRGYWTAGGLYAVQVYPIPKDINDTESFLKETKKFVPEYMSKDRARIGDFKLQEEKDLVVNGQPAYQAIAIEEGKAVFVATFELHPHRITVSSVVYPLKIGVPFKEQIPWNCYNRFVASVKETVPAR